MFEKMNKNKRYIILKDGNNYGLLIGIVVIAITSVLLFTSKSWLPDTRPNNTTKLETQLFFTLNTVTVNDYSIDYNQRIGEIHLSERKTSENEKYNLLYKVTDDKGNELPHSLIKGNKIKENEDSIISYQNSILQFGIYEGIYQIKIEVIQKDTTTEVITLDYRSIPQKVLTEKGQDYLLNLEQEEKVLREFEEKIVNLKDNKNTLEKELSELKALSQEEQDKRWERILAIDKRLPDLESEIENIEKNIKVYQENIERLKG